jgi:copper(I)-binding protein
MRNTIPQGRAGLIFCIAGVLFAGGLAAQEAAVVARDGWVRMPLPSKSEAALYMVLENHSAQRRFVVSATTDAAANAELHEMTMEKTVMRMTPVAKIGISAHGKTSFNPSGYHLMLFGLKTKPSIGDTINVTLKLDDGNTVPVTATVRK